MYRPLRIALKLLRQEFRRAATVYPPLFHERLSPWMKDTLPENNWKAFIAANSGRRGSTWETFDLYPDLTACSRFFGSEAGLEEFKRLGESLYLVLCEIDPSLDSDQGVHGLLKVLYRMAEYPTALLRVKAGVWGKEFAPAANAKATEAGIAWAEWFEDEVSRWTAPEDGGERYPTSPYCVALVQNVFTSALGAIQNVLDPEGVFLVGDAIDDLPSGLCGIATPPQFNDDELPEVPSEELVQVSQQDQETPEPTGCDKPPYQFQLIGEIWAIRFTTAARVEEGHFRDLEGFRHIAELLRHPEKVIEAIDLTGLQDFPEANLTIAAQTAFDRVRREDHDSSTPVGNLPNRGQRALDQVGKKDLEKMIALLDEKIAREEVTGDPRRVVELKEQHEQLSIYLRQGKHRRLGVPSPKEQARKSVVNANKRAIAKIERSMPECAKFLKRSIRPAGTARMYSPPAPAPTWVL